jgi:hypothetical protein
VYVYRNLRPYFKFTLPPVDICSAEKEVWTDVQAGTVDPAKAFDSLSQARCGGPLAWLLPCTRSACVLCLVRCSVV